MTREDETTEAIRKKAERMDKARKTPWSPWRSFADAGAVGWVFILPVIGFSVLGHFLTRGTGRPLLGAASVIVGVIFGGYLVWRQVRRTLDEEGE